MILAQRDPQWSSKKLGYGSGTIGQYGCVITSIAEGLRDRGYDETPVTVNEKTKAAGGYVAYVNGVAVTANAQNGGNLFVWSSLERSYPNIVKFISSEEYQTVPAPLTKLKEYLDKDYMVILQMSAVPIGVRDYHFVRAYKVDGNNVIIRDPWYAEEAPITKRFTQGNIDTAAEIISGFRVYSVVRKSSSPNMSTQYTEQELKDMRTDSNNWKAVCARFDITDPSQIYDKVDNLIKERDDARTGLENANKTIAEKNKVISELNTKLNSANETSDSRLKQYNDLIAYLADKLNCPQDENLIKGQIVELIEVEDKLRLADQHLQEVQKKHAVEKASLQEEINQLKIKIDQQEDQIQDLKEDIQILQDKIDGVVIEHNETNQIKNIISGIISFLDRFKLWIISEEKKESENKTDGQKTTNNNSK